MMMSQCCLWSGILLRCVSSASCVGGGSERELWIVLIFFQVCAEFVLESIVLVYSSHSCLFCLLIFDVISVFNSVIRWAVA